MFEQCLIVGAPYEQEYQTKPSPTILFLYPAWPLIFSPAEFQRVPLFCFPRGFDKNPPGRSPGDYLSEQFVFEMHSGCRRWRIYGVCIICDLSKVENAFFLNPNSREYPFAFCFLTSNPILSIQFHYLFFLMKTVTGTAGRYIRHQCSISAKHIESSMLLPGMASSGGVAQNARGLKIPKSLITELAYIRSVTPDLSRDVEVQLTEKHSMTIPSQLCAAKCVCYSSLDVLFSVLSIPHIVQALSVLLLEKHIVIRSKNVHNLTLSLLCLRELARPFRYRGTFLTVLPLEEDFLTLLESPVPFACGVLKTLVEIPIPAHVCIVDIDHDSIADPDSSPLSPSGQILIEKLRRLIELNRTDVIPPAHNSGRAAYLDFVKSKRNPLSSWHSYCMYVRKFVFNREMVDAIVLLMTDHIVKPLEDLVRSCLITDRTVPENPVTVFSRDLFIESVDPKDAAFYQLFIQTTMFGEFTELITDEPETSPLALSDASDITPLDLSDC
jgi:hypothetical protein